MTQQGAALQTYNNELVKSLEELKARRAALQQQIEAESLEKRKLEAEKARFGVILELTNLPVLMQAGGETGCCEW